MDLMSFYISRVGIKTLPILVGIEAESPTFPACQESKQVALLLSKT